MLISAVITGIILGVKKECTSHKPIYSNAKFNLNKSIKDAAHSTINICAFILFFSVICGILRTFIKNRFILSLIFPFLEISSASGFLANEANTGYFISMVLTSFAVSFSGISVYLQAKSLLPADISTKTYIYAKIMQGLISSAVTFFILILC
jgi:hypothetical protein